MLYADDACIVSRSPGVEVVVYVEVIGILGLTISQSKTETMCMPIPRAPATQIVFNAAGHRQITSLTYLGGTVTKTPNLSDEIDRRIRAGWMSFKRYTQELYGRPKASPAALEGLDGEVRGSRDSLIIRIRGMDPPEGPLHQAPYNTP